MGAIAPFILTLSLIIYTKAGPVGSNNTVQPDSGV